MSDLIFPVPLSVGEPFRKFNEGGPLAGSNRMKRIHLHWSAGGHKASASDLEHYHFCIQGDGTVIGGKKKPEVNESTSDGSYVAHTRGANTGAIGVALCAMRGAKESPFDHGPSPITNDQLIAMAMLCSDLCETYNIPVTRKTVLSHSEIQPTLGIKQRGKWDINWIPGMARAGDPVAVGDILRRMIKEAAHPVVPVLEPAPKKKSKKKAKMGSAVKGGGIFAIIGVTLLAWGCKIPGMDLILVACGG